jgi:iron(III) transport system substrate-binding protein
MTRRAAIAGALAATVAGRVAPVEAQSDAMKSLIAAAKAEGSVAVDAPPSDGLRDLFVQGFQRDYGIAVSFISGGSASSGARVRAERAAGKYLLDVFVTGSDTPLMTFLPSGWLDKVEPVLIDPEVIDKSKWRDGHLWYLDDGHMMLRTIMYVTPAIVVNSKYVKPSEVSTWKALLDPKWQGKIVTKDPGTPGGGTAFVAELYQTFGPDFIKKLFKDQKPLISRDYRQMTQFAATGNYPILIGPEMGSVQEFQRAGYQLVPVLPTDAPKIVTGGWGTSCLMNKAPHPNAAKLFINWLATRRIQEAFAKATLQVSLRTDVKYDGFPDWFFPQKGVKYLDTYDQTFVTVTRDAALQKARDILGE